MVDLLYLGCASLTDSTKRVTVPEADEVSFIEPGRTLSIIPDKRYDALSVVPHEIDIESINDYPVFRDNRIRTLQHRLHKVKVNTRNRLPIPAFARQEKNYESTNFRQFRENDTVYFVGRCDPSGTVERLYLLTRPDFLIGVYYYNDSVEWIGDSQERLEDNRYHVVHDWIEALNTPIESQLTTCCDVEQVFAETDELLRESVRSLRPDVRRQFHTTHIENEFGTVRQRVMEQLRVDADDSSRNRSWLRAVGKRTSRRLLVSVSEDRQRIVFSVSNQAPDGASAEPTVTVDDPALLWDCTCHGQDRSYHSDHWKTPPKHCKVHDADGGDVVGAAFNNDIVLIQHDQIGVYWYNSPDLWPPSMDTVRFYRAVTEELTSNTVSSILDVGSGTGFLATALAADNRPIDRIVATDWLLQPTVMSAINIANNLQSSWGIDSVVRPEVGVNWACDESPPVADVCVCNPPYLPMLEDHASLQYDHAVAGTELLESVIRHAPQLGSAVYVAYSRVATAEVEAVCAEAGREIRELDSVSTPFRVPPVLTDDAYVAALEDRGLRHEPTKRHPYWHDVVFASVEW